VEERLPAGPDPLFFGEGCCGPVLIVQGMNRGDRAGRLSHILFEEKAGGWVYRGGGAGWEMRNVGF